MTDVMHNTVFIRQKDVILTNDEWKIVVNIDLTFYEELIAKLKDDLHQTQITNIIFAPKYELNQVEKLLNELENEINSFREILPSLDSRRAVLNVAGSFFK
jgi:hypothetical protein